jgi:hypothetical protein
VWKVKSIDLAQMMSFPPGRKVEQKQEIMALDDDDDTTMTIHRPTQEEKDTYYKPGSIKRVKLTNFLTYDAVEFFPGPR